MLNDFQIENWRKLLLQQLGPYALIMPREDIEEYVKNLQKYLEEQYAKPSWRLESEKK
jgi:hypothetical protein